MLRSAGMALVGGGHDVVHMADLEPAADDHSVLARACESGRMFVTLDADFGDLAYKQGVAPPTAMLYPACTRSTSPQPQRWSLEPLPPPSTASSWCGRGKARAAGPCHQLSMDEFGPLPSTRKGARRQ
mgnify:CR=1 FL=1